MAKVHLINNNPPTVNSGEERALRFLENSLPDSITLIPNLTIPYLDSPEEYDIIAVAPDAVFVVEVKDLAGDLEFTEQELISSGSVRRNPYLSSRIKAQKLRSRLNSSLPWFATGGWVEHVVVLARQPRSLSICEVMKNRIVELPFSAPLINGGSLLIKEKHHGQLTDKADDIVNALVGVAKARQLPTLFGHYEGSSLLFDNGSFVVWKAKHQISLLDVQLEIHRQSVGLTKNQADVWKAEVLRLFDTSQRIGYSADIDGPRDVFVTEDGSVVIVWPDRDSNTLDHFLLQMRELDAGFTAERARRVVAGFAGSLHHLHSNGWILGGAPVRHDLVIRPNGRGAIVLGVPVPLKSGDTANDLSWLRSVLVEVDALVNDEEIKELVKALGSKDQDNRPSAGLVEARLEGAAPLLVVHSAPVDSSSSGASDYLSRYENQELLARHAFGETVRAFDAALKKGVILKRESGRPDTSWTLREYRALVTACVANSSGTVDVFAGGTFGDESYVVTEDVDGPTLATLMDSGELRDPEKAVAVVGRLLNTLQEIHPDVARINALIASVDGVLPPDIQEEIGALRESGLAHNHLDPSNIFVVEGRGVVVADFVRAARFGDEIPNRRPTFWPSEKPIQVSDPQADLYAVGALLLRMLVTTGGVVDASGNATPLIHQLIDVAQTAIAEDATKRFKTAAEFLDALTAVVAVSELPEVKVDLFELHREIEALVVAGRFDEALAKCPSSWTHTIEKINEKRALANHAGALLLEMHGLTLRYDGHVEFGPGTTIGGKDHNGGVADSYIVTVPGGGVLEIRVFSTDIDGAAERWVGVEQGFGHPERMNHAVRSHRMSISQEGEVEWMEITQSQLKKSGTYENQATRKQVTMEELSAPLGGVTAHQVLEPFGVVALGSRSEVLGDTNRRRNYLAAILGPDSQHAPAIVHFISRLIPLYLGVSEK